MRNILASALFQYSTKFQTFKQTALDKIVERIFYATDKTSINLREIQDTFQRDIGYVLPIGIFDESIKRLIKSNRILQVKDKHDEYSLNDGIKTELASIQSSFDRLFQRIIDKLFNNAPENRANYHEPFWFAMSYIFSNIGKFSAKLIEGQLDKETYIKPVLEKCFQKIENKFKINHQFFEKRIKFFFEETKDPAFNNFKWSLAQNYFIANSLGINPNSEVFSEEIFKNSILYLDTNVLLSLVSKNNRYYSNALSFIKAARKIDLKFCISRITIEEYERWVNAEKTRILVTTKQIPSATRSKIGSCIYQDLIEQSPSVNKDELLNEVIGKYLEYKRIIEELIPKDKLEYVDDVWFEEIESKDEYDETIAIVKEKYNEIGIRAKGENAAIHDAKMLLWLKKQQIDSGSNCWFITADSSLPLIVLDGVEKSDSILLEVILQWLVPLTKENGTEEFQNTFSEILKNRLLPKDILYEVNDFVIFEELHMECSELPSQDVEECILYLRKSAPNLNPNDPKDREKLANRIAVYFADPGRKYKTELTERLKENQELKEQLGDVFALLEKIKDSDKAKEIIIEDLKFSHSQELDELQKKYTSQICDVENRLGSVADQLSKMKNDTYMQKVKDSYDSWQKRGKQAFGLMFLFILFGILELLPAWNWNYPARIILYFDKIGPIAKAKYDILVGLNIFLLTSIIISLFVFAYLRLWDSDKKRKKLVEIKEEFKEY
ncbi:MAG: hypothetical protein JXC36_06090 [Candidatus Atribacteria bacterium]|nr:hypothetical protein [Candidatus Atribacteria bacterium]